MNHEILTVEQAAEYLQVSRAHMYRLTSKGALPIVKIGAGRAGRGTTRIRQSDLEEFIESRTVRSDGRKRRKDKNELLGKT